MSESNFDKTEYCEYCVNDDHARCRRIKRREGDVRRTGALKLKVCQCRCDGPRRFDGLSYNQALAGTFFPSGRF